MLGIENNRIPRLWTIWFSLVWGSPKSLQSRPCLHRNRGRLAGRWNGSQCGYWNHLALDLNQDFLPVSTYSLYELDQVSECVSSNEWCHLSAATIGDIFQSPPRTLWHISSCWKHHNYRLCSYHSWIKGADLVSCIGKKKRFRDEGWSPFRCTPFVKKGTSDSLSANWSSFNEIIGKANPCVAGTSTCCLSLWFLLPQRQRHRGRSHWPGCACLLGPRPTLLRGACHLPRGC